MVQPSVHDDEVLEALGHHRRLGEADGSAPVLADDGDAVEASAAPEAMPAALPTPGDLGLPAGSEVRRMTAAGHRLILVVAVPDAGERIVIVDLRNGGTVANIGLEGAP